MAPLPTYSISEQHFAQALFALQEKNCEVTCTTPRHELKTNQTMYRDWKIASPEGYRVILWDEYPLDREALDDHQITVTVGTPDGSKAVPFLRIVQNALVNAGALEPKSH